MGASDAAGEGVAKLDSRPEGDVELVPPYAAAAAVPVGGGDALPLGDGGGVVLCEGIAFEGERGGVLDALPLLGALPVPARCPQNVLLSEGDAHAVTVMQGAALWLAVTVERPLSLATPDVAVAPPLDDAVEVGTPAVNVGNGELVSLRVPAAPSEEDADSEGVVVAEVTRVGDALFEALP